MGASFLVLGTTIVCFALGFHLPKNEIRPRRRMARVFLKMRWRPNPRVRIQRAMFHGTCTNESTSNTERLLDPASDPRRDNGLNIAS